MVLKHPTICSCYLSVIYRTIYVNYLYELADRSTILCVEKKTFSLSFEQRDKRHVDETELHGVITLHQLC